MGIINLSKACVDVYSLDKRTSEEKHPFKDTFFSILVSGVNSYFQLEDRRIGHSFFFLFFTVVECLLVENSRLNRIKHVLNEDVEVCILPERCSVLHVGNRSALLFFLYVNRRLQSCLSISPAAANVDESEILDCLAFQLYFHLSPRLCRLKSFSESLVHSMCDLLLR